MLHHWKHAFTLYLYVSTQSTLKQKFMPYSKILPITGGTTGECDCWNLTQDSETGKWFCLTNHMYVTGQNEIHINI